VFATLQVIMPAAIIVAAGYIVGKRVMDAAGIKALSDLVFFLFLPCLLFRAMATSTFRASDAAFIAVYFGATMLWFLCVVMFTRHQWKESMPGAVVLGITAVFSNTVQLGIPIQKLAYGEAGLKLQLSIIAVHALIIITTATIWIEVWKARQTAKSGTEMSIGRTIAHLVKSAVIHPVILPILIGLIWSFTKYPLPRWVDEPLSFLSSAAGPIMLVLMGAQLSKMVLRAHMRAAITFVIVKNIIHPLIVFVVCWAVGLPPLYTAVAVVCAALPTGANAFLFAQRYRVNEDTVTAATALSSIVALVTLTIVLTLVPKPF
jgi:malonate transporter and related proteins